MPLANRQYPMLVLALFVIVFLTLQLMIEQFYTSFMVSAIISLIIIIYYQHSHYVEIKARLESRDQAQQETIAFEPWVHANILSDQTERSIISVVDNLPDGVLVIDNRMQIVWANSSSSQIFGIQRTTDVGRSILQRLADPDILDIIKRYFKQDKQLQSETIDSPFYDDEYLRIDVMQLNDEHTMVLGSDHTEQVNTQKIRVDFVANASHELRTPLTVINGYIELLIDSLSDSDEQKIDKTFLLSPLESMHTQSMRIMNIINDLLLLSRSINSVQKHSEGGVDLKQLIKQAVSDAEEMQTNHVIELDISETRALKGSLTLIQSLVSNLILNAVNHTPPETALKISWKQTPENGAMFSVQDFGQGIPPHHLSRITERFYRVDKSHSRLMANQGSGTGLGLAIVKHAASSSNGELSVQSILGEGSTFTCTWPNTALIEGDRA